MKAKRGKKIKRWGGQKTKKWKQGKTESRTNEGGEGAQNPEQMKMGGKGNPKKWKGREREKTESRK